MKEHTIAIKVLLEDHSDTDWIYDSIIQQIDPEVGETILEFSSMSKELEA